MEQKRLVYLDSYIFLEFFLKGKGYYKAKEILRKVNEGNLIGITNTITLFEIRFRLAKCSEEVDLEKIMILLRYYPNTVIKDIDKDTAEVAAKIRLKYYNKAKLPLSLADSIHLATSFLSECTEFYTGDEDFKNIEEIKTIII